MVTEQPKAPVRGGLPEVEAYIAALPDTARPMMEALRAAIRRAAPEAEEVLSYGMPAFVQDDQRFIYYAGWKQHCSVYGLTNGVLDQFKSEVAPYVTPKGMLKFDLYQQLPIELLAKLVRARLAELDAE